MLSSRFGTRLVIKNGGEMEGIVVVGLKIGMVVLALSWLAHDLYEIIIGKTDMNRHIPLLLPLVFTFFFILLLKLDRSGRKPTEHSVRK